MQEGRASSGRTLTSVDPCRTWLWSGPYREGLWFVCRPTDRLEARLSATELFLSHGADRPVFMRFVVPVLNSAAVRESTGIQAWTSVFTDSDTFNLEEVVLMWKSAVKLKCISRVSSHPAYRRLLFMGTNKGQYDLSMWNYICKQYFIL